MNTISRWQQRFEDFEKAIQRLQEALSNDQLSELEQDGVIQRFEFTFELAWKTLKDYLEDQGFKEIASPKKAIQQAFESNLIIDGNSWIEMLEDRNRMSHMYDRQTSRQIFENIRDKHATAFEQLLEIFKKDLL